MADQPTVAGRNYDEHALRFDHRRTPMAEIVGVDSSWSSISIDAESTSLTEAWRELLSRMPSDTYAALKAAMGVE